MLIGIIADIHANLEALNAVREQMEREPVDRVIFLGDVVGYGADPEACCKIVRDWADVALMGNHDAALVGLLSHTWFVSHARAAIEWSKDKVSADCIEWLSKRPHSHKLGEYVFSHGSAVEPDNFDYILSRAEADNNFNFMEQENTRVVIVGHAHQFNCYRQSKPETMMVDGVFQDGFDLEKDDRYVINIGSVGQPRDGDVRATFGLLDTEALTYNVKRVVYDYETASDKIAKAGLPDILSQRLRFGR
jgi:diadenosine tetraphosphatase ApaH/serine/threonine PP2A family protein phosphatase